jgi:hypothetical protein
MSVAKPHATRAGSDLDQHQDRQSAGTRLCKASGRRNIARVDFIERCVSTIDETTGAAPHKGAAFIAKVRPEGY